MEKVTIQHIKEQLSKELPGEEAHVEMSPIGGGRSSIEIQKVNHYKESAVAMVIFQQQDELQCVLMQRNQYLGVHSGQVCFPGGKREDIDSDLKQTALRETIEEIGLELNAFEWLGDLTPVFIPVSGHHVQPYVFFYHETPTFYPDEREVAEVITFPLIDLFSDHTIQSTTIELSSNRTLKDVPYYAIREKIVWGATALILHEFKNALL